MDTTQTIETPKVESEQKLLKDVLETRQKSDIDMLYVYWLSSMLTV